MTKTLDKMDVTDNLRVALIGAPGSGKTALAATFPDPAFADLDYGLKTVRAPWFRKKYPGVDLSRIRYETFSDERNSYGVFKTARAYWDMVDWLNKQVSDPEVKTLVIDSATTLSNLAMHVGLELNKASGRSKTLTSQTTMKAILPTMADFGSEMNLVEQLFDQLTALDKNIVVIFHERVESSDSGATLRLDPQITGSKLRAKFGRWFDEVWYLDVKGMGEKRTRVLQTDSDHIKKTLKSRLGVPNGMEDPSYEKIIRSIKG
jgi:hypothetical protein